MDSKGTGETYNVMSVKWGAPEAEEARRIRLVVFVQEQKVPLEEEIDDIDPGAYHVVVYNSKGEPCGTARLFSDPLDSRCARIGRMAVLKRHRGSGCGSILLSKLMIEAKQQGYSQAVLSAQAHAVPFYEKHGFQKVGDQFEEAGIPHYRMWRNL